MRNIRRMLFVLALGVWALPAAAQQKPDDRIQAKLARRSRGESGVGLGESRARASGITRPAALRRRPCRSKKRDTWIPRMA